MNRFLLFSHLILALSTPVLAKETCTFTSQYEPEVTIDVSTKYLDGAMGFMKYKGDPIFAFSTNIRNGYGGQHFTISNIRKLPTEKVVKIVNGTTVTIVGDQASSRGTPKDKRKKGQRKLFFPNFGTGYYYSLAGDGTKPDGRWNRTEKINTILNASEGFWIPSEKCKKYVYYAW